MKTTVYTPDSSLANPFVMLRRMFADLWAGRELAWRRAARDISAQSRQTFLGILCALILPLSNTLAWLYLNGSGIVVLQKTDIPPGCGLALFPSGILSLILVGTAIGLFITPVGMLYYTDVGRALPR